MYSSTSFIGISRRPPAAFSWPPPLKYMRAHMFAEVPFFERMETLILSLSSFSRRLMRTFEMESGMFTNPSVSPS